MHRAIISILLTEFYVMELMIPGKSLYIDSKHKDQKLLFVSFYLLLIYIGITLWQRETGSFKSFCSYSDSYRTCDVKFINTSLKPYHPFGSN